jgi:glutaredoxin 3
LSGGIHWLYPVAHWTWGAFWVHPLLWIPLDIVCSLTCYVFFRCCQPGERHKPTTDITSTLLAMSLPTLYIKTGCPWCIEVVAFLTKHGIDVDTVVVSGNPDAMRDMIALSGQSKAPTMNWHGEVLADFGVEELAPFLKQRNRI